MKEITLQNNIRMIYDHSFNGSSIEKIIKNDEPNSISVGDNLLINALVYVDKENLSAYKTGYNWAKYFEYIYSI